MVLVLYNPQINICHFFQDVYLDIQCYQCLYMGGTLCRATAPTIYTVLFETLHVLMAWPEDMYLLRTKISD